MRGRLRNVVRRSVRAVARGGRTLLRIAPLRSAGAVQGPPHPPGEETDVWGWAWLGREPVAAVHVTLDGMVVTQAGFEPTPRDVVRRFPEARWSRHCGWRARVDFSAYTGRRVRVGALVVSTHGEVVEADSIQVEVAVGLPGGVDAPSAAAVAGGALTVTGWMLPGPTPPVRVEVSIDGRPAGRARLFVPPRRERARETRWAYAPVAGFEYVAMLDEETRRPVRLDAELVSAGGARTALAPVTVPVVAPADEEGGDLDRLRVLDARVRSVPRPTTARTASPLRLVVFAHQLDLGGGQLYLQQLLLGLLEDRALECLVISATDGPLRAELEAAGAAVHVTAYPMQSATAYAARLLELAHLVGAFDADVVLTNTMLAGVGADLARRLGIPCVWAIHESVSLEEFWVVAYHERPPEAVRSAITEALRSAAGVVFEADWTRELYSPHTADRAVTIPYGIDVAAVDAFLASSDRDRVRRRLGIGGETVVLSMATFEPRKAQAALALAFASVAEEYHDATLVLVGDNDSPYARAVHEVADRLELGSRLRLELVTPDVYDWYLACDAFVLASDLESMPRSLMEVMAFGTPVAAAATAGVPELVEHGTSGLLFEPRDLDALADALRRLLRLEPSERRRLGANAARVVRERHDAPGYVGALRRLLTSVGDPP